MKNKGYKNLDYETYKYIKIINSFIFDSNIEYEFEPGLYDIRVLKQIEATVLGYTELNEINSDLKNNILNYLDAARKIDDEDKSERIKIINNIIVSINSQCLNKYLDLYRTELYRRRRNAKYLLTYPDSVIKSQIQNVNDSILNDSVVLESHSDTVTDEEFQSRYLPLLEDNLYYYESLNVILEEYPKAFANPTFYSRFSRVLTENQRIDETLTDYNRVLTKKADRKKRKYN